MEFKTFTILDEDGRVVRDAQVYVRPQGAETLANVFDIEGNELTQPLATNARGQVSFARDTSSVDISAIKSGEEIRLQRVQFLNAVDTPGDYSTREAFKTALSRGLTKADGKVVIANGLAYKAQSGAAADSDLPDWLPAGVGYLRHFGATGDGSTDDASAVQAAFNWMAGAKGRRLLGDDGATYALGSTVSHTGRVDVDFTDVKFLVTTNSAAFSMSPTLYGPYSLGADYTAGDLFIDMTGDPLPSAPVEGQVLKIQSDATDPGNRDQGSEARKYRVAEFFVVGSGSTTTNIVLTRPLRFITGISPASTAGEEAVVDSYTTANNARVAYADNDTPFRWIGGEVAAEEGHDADPWNDDIFRVIGYVSPAIKDLTISRGYSHGIDLQGTYQARVTDCTVKNLTDNTSQNQYGYGIADAGCLTFVTGFATKNTRHGYTTSALSVGTSPTASDVLRCGRTCGAVISGVNGGDSQAPWDTHADAEDTTFSSAAGTGMQSRAVGIRGRNVTHIFPVCVNSGEGIFAFTEAASGNSDDDLYFNAKDPDWFTKGRVTGPSIICDRYPVRVSHADLNLSGSGVFETKDHRCLWLKGGQLTVSGNHSFKVKAGDGFDNTAVVHCDAAEPDADVFSENSIFIEGVVDIDASEADASGITLFGGDGDRIVIRDQGRLRVKLPAGASYKSGSVEVETHGSGAIEFSVAGAADNTALADADDLEGCSVRALDNTVSWVDPTFPNQPLNWISTFSEAGSVVSHTGTGSVVYDVYTPDGQRGFKAMNEDGYGEMEIHIHGFKGGTTGPARILIRDDSSTFIASVDIGQNADFWDLRSRLVISATDQQRFISSCASDQSTFVTGSTETLAPTTGQRPFRIGFEAAVGDSIDIYAVSVHATSGGIL